jgi:hypothetical protein
MTKTFLLHFRYFLLVALLAGSPLIFAEEKENGEGEEKQKTMAELTENTVRKDGLFTLFQDNKTGKVYMLIKPEQIGKEFIYFAHATNGAVQAGYFRGAYLDNGVISIRRYFNKIEFVRENTAYYFDPDNALSKAADANISEGVLAVEKIAAEDESNGAVLINVDKVFLSEALLQVKPAADPDADAKTTFTLGELSDSKSKFLGLRSYPQNTDLEVEYVYSDKAPVVDGEDAISDSRNVAIRVMHSLIEMPENGYLPRRDDPRVGYFRTEATELTSFSATPFHDFITRWNLVKKDPDAELSEPLTPITWWIENTTPVEFRELIRSAALAWNPAFESAGFKNALVVKIQPDDADWEAGDIRYNVLRWTASPNPPFGGYGPSFVNPRTGQILGADVMLEYSFLGRYLHARQLLANEPALPLLPQSPESGRFCALAQSLQISNMFGMVAAEVSGYSDVMDEQLVHDTIYYLILHELGHTLGLNHNMKATQLLTKAQAFDPKAVAELGLAGSVMDYPAVNFAPRGQTQTQFYATRPGPYDEWVIQYGYSDGLADAAGETMRLESILARSTEPALAFGNDADDMRSPGKGIDPRVNIYDMSSDAVAYAADRIDLLQSTINDMVKHYPEAGDSYQETYDAFLVMMKEWGRSAAVISRYIGGVEIDRGMAGQQGAVAPYTPVALVEQQQAMAILKGKVFSPNAFSAPEDLYRHLAQQRRGFNFYSTTEDPKVHDAVLALQKSVLDHILHPVVMKRLTDSRLYGNGYDVSMFITELTEAIFMADVRGNVNTFRQNLQMDYVNRLSAMVRGEQKATYDTPSQNMAVYALNEIRDMQDRRRNVNVETEAHAENLKLVIAKALDTGS